MAANKAVVHVSASVLPDELKRTISGTASHDLNDGVGDADAWIYYLASIGTASEVVLNGTPSFLVSAGDSTANVAATDNVQFVILHHTGYQSDGTTKTADNAYLYFNIHNATAAAGAANMWLKPGEVWWGRVHTNEIQHIKAIASTGTINVAMYAIVDDE